MTVKNGVGLGLALIMGLAMASTLGAQVTVNDSINVVAASSLEAKATVSREWKIPVLTGEGPLLEGNNIKLKLSGELSPVSVNAGVDAVLTPVAVLEFSAGAQIGSGWNFLGIANGIGMTERRSSGSTPPTTDDKAYVISTDPFIGAVYKVKAGAAFQFDTGAVIPGDWSHVIIRTYHEVNYRGLSSATPSDSWEYEANGGKTRNGLGYYGNYVLAYQTPTILNTAGILIETERTLYGTPGSEAWGEGLMYLNGGPLLNLKFSDSISLAILAQWKTVPAYTAATEYEFYQDRLLEVGLTKIVFNRVALSATFMLP